MIDGGVDQPFPAVSDSLPPENCFHYGRISNQSALSPRG